MKLSIILLFQLITISSFSQNSTGQEINNSNYYSFIQNIPGNSINWLRSSDVVPIIIDELLKNNIQYYTIGVGEILKIDDSTRFSVTVSFSKNDKEYGFFYEPTHGLPLNKKNRDFLNGKEKVSFITAERDLKGETTFMLIDPVPNNIFLLKQTCYWYQFDSKGTKYNVDKEIAKNILRQDIDEYLKRL